MKTLEKTQQHTFVITT